MGLFGDIGRIAREVKTITDDFKSIKDDVVSQAKDLKDQALDVEATVKSGVKDTIQTGKNHVTSKVTDTKDEIKKNISL